MLLIFAHVNLATGANSHIPIEFLALAIFALIASASLDDILDSPAGSVAGGVGFEGVNAAAESLKSPRKSELVESASAIALVVFVI